MSDETNPPAPRCGDTVHHRPTGDTWIVAYADPSRDELSWFGWPDGAAKLSDCDVVERCTAAEHAAAVSQWLDVPHRSDDYSREDSRVARVRHLYRPEEERKLVRDRLNADCVALADRLIAHDADLALALRAFALAARDAKEGGQDA